MNHLYFGDSLDILKQLHAQHPQGFIDLVYIDPPFNSKRNYNVLFETVALHDAKAQKEAFADTWSNVSYKDTLSQLVEIDKDLYEFLNALDHVRISQSAVSYLTTMAIRIYYIHKVLKDTGSFYLHCDPTMSHYLKIVCDLVFGEDNFRNEIIWNRSTNSGSSKSIAKRFSTDHDVIFSFSKDIKQATFNKIFKEYSEDYIKHYYIYDDDDGKGRYQVQALKTVSEERLESLKKEGRIVKGEGQYLRFKDYLKDKKGVPINDIWIDIEPVNPIGKEKLGYPTQKPEALLERIIQASSNEGDVVADFFCGCGTTVAAAEKLHRKWIGVDISHLAIGLIRKRLIDTYGEKITKTFTVDGLPRDIASAKALALAPQGRMHFQDWVIETLLGGVSNEKKSADGGYDGYTTFEVERGKKEIVLIEVKSGNVNVKNIREFINVVEKQKAGMGVFVCFSEQVTKPMQSEAKDAGYFRKDIYDTRYGKVQILTVEDLLAGKQPDMPRSTETGPFKKAEKAEVKKKGQKGLFD